MIDFTKRLNGKREEKEINPIEIYDSLDRIVEKGPLRPAQVSILENWFSDRIDKKDTIIKLHTGQGKTLIGLLILQSRLNSGNGPAVYVCPDKLLVEQTCFQAKQFGIEYVTIEKDGSIPEAFIDSKSILIVHVQKIFNGLTKFKLGNRSAQIGTIILDDSHACIDSIEASSSIKVIKEKSEALYNEIFSLFESYLEDQGYATFSSIKSGESYDVMLVPYWAWNEKVRDVADVLVKYKADKSVLFAWELIRDELEHCYCIISSGSIEILPLVSPIDKYGFFHDAPMRIMMSATTNNDAFFVKSLGIDKATVSNPLTYDEEKWSGEKMILMPYYIDERLNRTEIVNWFAKENNTRNFGVVVLTPRYDDANYWGSLGATVATKETIPEVINTLKSENYHKTVVFANRYDGIDLPDNHCRILIMDKKPFAQTLSDQYQEDVRSGSDLINIKIAQKIEQGLGRGVRGEKDYCAIILTGSNLLAAIKDKNLRNFFSPQTRKQIEIGHELTSYAIQDSKDSHGADAVVGALNQCLQRDKGWKEFYKSRMNEIEHESKDDHILDILYLERKADNHYIHGEYEKSRQVYQEIIDKHIKGRRVEEGWYLQEMARSIYPISREDSNRLQISAHKKNRYLLKPSSGMAFEKLTITQTRVVKIREWIQTFDSYIDLKIQLDNDLSDLVFGPHTKKFEQGIENLGNLIGYGSERPESEWKQGPDNLWCIAPQEYIVIECKSGVHEDRAEIVQHEAEQLLHSMQWFKTRYKEVKAYPLMIINTRKAERGVHLSDGALICKKSKLGKLKKRVVEFYASFKNVDFSSISETSIQQNLLTHQLENLDILNLFEDVYYID